MFKLGMIGLDTSHSVKFTELIQGGTGDCVVEGIRIARCLRFPSAFHSESDQDVRQAAVEGLGVVMAGSVDELLSDVDGILLEINDPSLHLHYFEMVSGSGLPVFIDKPLADNLESGSRICRIAEDRGISVWSASSLRFTPEVVECAAAIRSPLLCNVFAPLGKAAKGSSVVWYGVHAFEILLALMGRGSKSVRALEDASGVVAMVGYPDGRRGVVEANIGHYQYGGRLQDRDGVRQFVTVGSPYPGLIKALADFFLNGHVPVPLDEALEIQALLAAVEKSVASGTVEAVQTEF